MVKRVEFQRLLETLTPNVYFQPPSTTTIKYPCIVYTRASIDKLKANNKNYKINHAYDVTVIDRNPDSPIAQALMEFNYSDFDRQFVSDGLNHIAFKIFY